MSRLEQLARLNAQGVDFGAVGRSTGGSSLTAADVAAKLSSLSDLEFSLAMLIAGDASGYQRLQEGLFCGLALDKKIPGSTKVEVVTGCIKVALTQACFEKSMSYEDCARVASCTKTTWSRSYRDVYEVALDRVDFMRERIASALIKSS